MVRAHRPLSRQFGECESGRERLQQAVAELANDANDNTARLAGAVRQALTQAQESPATVATPTEMRDFVEQFVGPMVLKPDGGIERKETTAAEAGAAPAHLPTGDEKQPLHARRVTRSIAGAGFERTTSGS